MNGQAVCVGDAVRIPSVTFSEKGVARPWMKGTVVWIHPLRRFCVVEYRLLGGNIRECCKCSDIRKDER